MKNPVVLIGVLEHGERFGLELPTLHALQHEIP